MNDGTITIKDCAALLILAASLAFSTQTPAHAATVGERPGGYEATQNMTSGALPHVYQTDAAGQSLENAGAAGQTAAAAGQAAGAAGQTAADGTALGETAADGETLPVPDPVPTETAYLTAAIADGNTVAVSGKVTGEYSAEDGKLYFFALQPWQDGITGEPVMSTNEAGEFSFRLPLNEGTADTRLYSGFAAAVWLIFLPLTGLGWPAARSGLIAGLAFGGGLLGISLLMDRILKRDSLGGGDITLFAVLGLYLGVVGTLFMTVLACLLGLLFAVLRRGRTGGGEPFPFGPAIAAAGAAMLLWGEPLIHWYLSLF